MGTYHLPGNTGRRLAFVGQASRQAPKEEWMSKSKITVTLNGSLKVEGDVGLVDHEGREIPTREGVPFFLCRCGASENKPFCDGSHKRVGFLAD